MSYAIRTRDQHLANDARPKRILALDGGGLRGILTLGILEKIEEALRERHGSREFRLSHYFDLIAGTSTGAIIAATLGLGWTVAEIREKYMKLGARVFSRNALRWGLIRAKYDEKALIEELKEVFGEKTTLGGPELQTGVLIVTKRLDSGSWWPISNNPRGKYFAARPNGVLGNGDYPLWQVVRASTAAPSYFEPERITITQPEGDGKPVEGEFVDGGMSPFNNPALIAVMYGTLDGYRVGWPTGGDKLFVVSVGTGAADPSVAPAKLAVENAMKSLLALMGDCAQLQETMLQWMSSSRTARPIDRELGDLQHDLVAGAPLISYLRYNVDLAVPSVQALDPSLTDEKKIRTLSEMDSPANMATLYDLGLRGAARDVRESDFPMAFDLPVE